MNMNGARILLVSGNLYKLRLLSDLLLARGIQATAASNGKQWLCWNHLFCPDLVIMDLHLADLKSAPAGTHSVFPQKVPVIFLSTLDKEYRSACGLEIDGLDCFIEPFDVDALLSRAQEILYHQASRRSREPARSRSKNPGGTCRRSHSRPSRHRLDDVPFRQRSGYQVGDKYPVTAATSLVAFYLAPEGAPFDVKHPKVPGRQ